MPEDHSYAGPSGAPRWMACPASVTVKPPIPPAASFYAKEGTAAHWAAEKILHGEMFLPHRIDIEGESFAITKEMMDYLEPYFLWIEEVMRHRKHSAVETRVEVSGTDGMVWGTADFFAWDREVLDVVDFKYGAGVPVAPNSPQIMIYSLGALEHIKKTHDYKPQVIRQTIVQPRLDPTPRHYIMSYEDLMTWAAKEFYPAVDKILQGDRTEVAGDHCRFCPRKTTCEAYSRRHAQQAKRVFEAVE